MYVAGLRVIYVGSIYIKIVLRVLPFLGAQRGTLGHLLIDLFANLVEIRLHSVPSAVFVKFISPLTARRRSDISILHVDHGRTKCLSMLTNGDANFRESGENGNCKSRERTILRSLTASLQRDGIIHVTLRRML